MANGGRWYRHGGLSLLWTIRSPARLKSEIARFSPVEEIRLFTAEIFGNRIVCILVPGDWKYEMIEIWGRHTLWGGEEDVIVQDREGMTKKGYSPISVLLEACA